MEAWQILAIIIGASVGISTLILTIASYLHTNEKDYIDSLKDQCKDCQERFKLCHNERISLESELKRVRLQLFELMLDSIERP